MRCVGYWGGILCWGKMESYEAEELAIMLHKLDSIRDERLSSEEFSDLLNLFDIQLRRYLAAESLRVQSHNDPDVREIFRLQHERIYDELADLHLLVFEQGNLKVRDVFRKFADWLDKATARGYAVNNESG